MRTALLLLFFTACGSNDPRTYRKPIDETAPQPQAPAVVEDYKGLRGIKHLRFKLEVTKKRPLFGEPFQIYIQAWNPNDNPVAVKGLIDDLGHGILRVEFQADGGFKRLIYGVDPCLLEAVDAYLSGRRFRRHNHNRSHTRLKPYEVQHHWQSLPVSPPEGSHQLRLTLRGQVVAGPIGFTVRSTPGNPFTDEIFQSLPTEMDSSSSAFLGQSNKNTIAQQKKVLELLAKDDDARTTLQYRLDCLQWSANPAARIRLRALAKDRGFHLRHTLLKRLTRLAETQPERAHYRKLIQQEWPAFKKPKPGVKGK
ncbi:hypothetical protein JYT84_00760 [bacterium AH-315-M10]|nr:hypothetical protein [bacterium AH-315-M10]